MAPPICAAAAASPNASQPMAAPTRGSRLTNAPATSAVTFACPSAKSQNGSSVPSSDRATYADTAPAWAGADGAPPVTTAIGSATSPPAPNCTAVTAAGARFSSSLGCVAMKPAESTAEANTSRSPSDMGLPPPTPATRLMPPSARPEPPHVRARARPCPSAAVISATRTGTVPRMTAAWLTLVRSIPAFWSMITPPNPIAPATATRGCSASRSEWRPMIASIGALTANRATVSHAGSSQPMASFDSGTVRPHRRPAAASAANGA